MKNLTNILEFADVTLASLIHEQSGMKKISFKAGSGCLILIRVEDGNENLPLADAAEGLLQPDAGAVSWRGRDWRTLSPESGLLARARIGRIYEKNAWISNLNVLENITLSQRHHTSRPEGDIIAEADSLAKNFGLPEAPRRRPAMVPKRELKISEWVRAFMANPILLLLERPETGVAAESLSKLCAAVDTARARGAAVIWQTDREEIWGRSGSAGAVHYQMRGLDMLLADGTGIGLKT